MTNTVLFLSNVRNYDGNLKINITNGSSLPISAVGDLSSSLTDVFVSPNLCTNLLSLVNWLIIIVMSISPVLVVLCRIKCPGR